MNSPTNDTFQDLMKQAEKYVSPHLVKKEKEEEHIEEKKPEENFIEIYRTKSYIIITHKGNYSSKTPLISIDNLTHEIRAFAKGASNRLQPKTNYRYLGIIPNDTTTLESAFDLARDDWTLAPVVDLDKLATFHYQELKVGISKIITQYKVIHPTTFEITTHRNIDDLIYKFDPQNRSDLIRNDVISGKIPVTVEYYKAIVVDVEGLYRFKIKFLREAEYSKIHALKAKKQSYFNLLLRACNEFYNLIVSELRHQLDQNIRMYNSKPSSMRYCCEKIMSSAAFYLQLFKGEKKFRKTIAIKEIIKILSPLLENIKEVKKNKKINTPEFIKFLKFYRKKELFYGRQDAAKHANDANSSSNPRTESDSSATDGIVT